MFGRIQEFFCNLAQSRIRFHGSLSYCFIFSRYWEELKVMVDEEKNIDMSCSECVHWCIKLGLLRMIESIELESSQIIFFRLEKNTYFISTTIKALA